VARALALVPDLMFGSRLQSALGGAGHSVELVASERLLRARLQDRSAGAPEVLIVDLTDAELDGAGIVAGLLAEGELSATRTLGFYSHVDAPARERAERAGIELVVPRSRMAREAPALLERLTASAHDA
jgi:hypothetical protein